MIEERSISDKMRTLDRRREHLRERIETGYGSPGSIFHMKAERDALDSAMKALRLHSATLNLLDDPLDILRDLAEAVQDKASHGKLMKLSEQAFIVLEDFETPEEKKEWETIRK